MHTELTLNLVRLDLQFDTRPKLDAQGTIVTDAKGKIVFEPNERREPYIGLFDCCPYTGQRRGTIKTVVPSVCTFHRTPDLTAKDSLILKID